MTSEYKRKTLVDVDLPIWAEVKHFATLKELSINDAMQTLLRVGLKNHGYNGPVREQKMVRSGESLTASSQDIPSLEFQ